METPTDQGTQNFVLDLPKPGELIISKTPVTVAHQAHYVNGTWAFGVISNGRTMFITRDKDGSWIEYSG